MTEDQLRALVREIVSRHMGLSGTAAISGKPAWKTHPSHRRLSLPPGQQGEGPCLIEPAVRCTHCGYCQSLGH